MNRIKSDDDDRILKDGERLRVSMTMRDALRGTGSRGPRGQAPGDICTVNGSEGRLRNVKGDLVCVPLKSQDAKPQFTDGRTTDALALHRPGYRIPVVQDRRAVHDAYRRVELGQSKAYRIGDSSQCAECFGSGEDEDGEACSACNGTGIMPNAKTQTPGLRGSAAPIPDPASDSLTTLDQHRQNMDRLYAEHDAELSNAWRGQR